MTFDDLLTLFERLQSSFPALTRVEKKADREKGPILLFQFADFRPGEGDRPFTGFCGLSESLAHPLFGEETPAVELYIGLRRLEVDSPDYIKMAAQEALPFIDHQRFCPGVSAKWNPDTGVFSVSALVRDLGQSNDLLEREVTDAVRNCIALIYLAMFKMWSISLSNSLTAEMAAPHVQEADEKMHRLLGMSVPGDDID